MPQPAQSTAADPAPLTTLSAAGEVVSLRRILHGKQRPRPVRIAGWVGVAGAFLAGFLWGVPWLRHTAIPWFMSQYADTSSGSGAGLMVARLNCHFALPGPAWKEDDTVRPFGVAQVKALRRTDPNAWLVLAARDYKTRAPRAGEMVEEVVNRLGEFFRGLEWELKPNEELAGQQAQHLYFQGEVNYVVMAGDCCFFTSKGIAYWVATWGPIQSADQTRAELRAARQGLTLLKERDGWTEKRPPVVTFRGTKAAYSLQDTEDLWKEWNEPKAVDDAADLLVQGRDRVETKDVDKMAQVAVLLLGKQTDLPAAVKAARAHLDQQQRKLYPATTVEVIRDQEGAHDRDAPVGKVAGHLLKLKVKNSPDRQRFVVLAVVHQPEQVLVIQCECDWKRRSLWEGDFKQLLSTFSPRAEEP